jgi:hypothetical protein
MILCPTSPKIWQEYFTSLYILICWVVTLEITRTDSSFLLILHVSTLWFFLWQFVQYIHVFCKTIWGFWANIVLLFCGIDKLLIVFTSEIPSSQTKTTSLCYYKVSLFMHVVATRKCGCNLDLKIIVRKLFIVMCFNYCVVTLTLGLRPKQGLVRGRDKRETREAHLILSGVQESVREWTLTLPRQLPLGELESRRTPESSGNDCRGQNTLVWRVLYIIGKILKLKCLKWAHITHLDIWNTSYGQKKGWESNWQFDSRPLKVRNRPDFLVFRWCATYHWKALNEGYNFALDLITIKSLHTKLWGSKVTRVPTLVISELPLRVSGQKAIWMWASWRGTKYTIRGKVVASPNFGSWWVLWVQVCSVFVLASKVL